MKLILTFIFIFISANIFAQLINGVVVDENNEPLKSVSVYLRKASTKNVIAFTVSDVKGEFSFKQSLNTTDSLELRCTYLGYQPQILIFLPVAGDSVSYVFHMTKSSSNLPEVVLNAPKVWSRGDTTFLSVSGFKEGDERKLQDILEKMPGFKINEQGKATYNGKVIEKILVDGDNLFEEKTALLLKNFPIHVIENVQVLQNQTDNLKLKGLDNSQKVFLNLQLKKKKITTAFGDGEAGVDTEKRYYLNSVLFSLAGKTKIGFITNYSSQGNGIGRALEEELKFNEVLKAEEWLMNSNFLVQKQDLENRYFINNKQWENRLKINFSISEKVKQETEINFLKDNQHQSSIGTEMFLNNGSFINRSIQTEYYRQPDYLQIKHQFKFDIDSLKELKVSAFYYQDKSSASMVNSIQQDDFQDSIFINVKNNIKQFKTKLEFVNRKNAGKGYLVDVSYSFNRSNQNAISFSNEYQDVFQIINPDYKLLNQPIIHDHSFFSAGFNLLKKVSAKMSNHEWRFNSEAVTQHSNPFLLIGKELPEYMLTDLSGNGKYKKYEFVGNYTRSLNVFNTNVFLNTKYGYGFYENSEREIYNKKQALLYGIEISFKTKLSKFKDNARVSFGNSFPSLNSYSTEIWSSAANNFKRFRNLNVEPVNEASVSYFYSLKIKKHVFLSSLNANIYSGGFASKYQSNKLIYIVTDTFVRAFSTMNFFSLNYFHVSKPLRMLIEGGLSLGNYQNNIIIDEENIRTSNNSFDANVSLKRNWSKKYFIGFKIKGRIAKSGYINYNLPSRSVINYSTLLTQKYVLNKNFTALLSFSYFNFDVQRNGSRDFLYGDAGIQFSISKLPLQWSLNVQNLTNAKYLEENQNLPYFQSAFKIPLITRNILIRARYEF